MKRFITCALLSAVFLSACNKDEGSGNGTVSYEVVTRDSYVEWRGYLPEGNNHGTFSVSNTEITTEDGKVIGGSFTIPVSSVNVLNLGGELKEQLQHHLMSADFFNAALHPDVTFRIKEATDYTGSEGPGVVSGANYSITGELNILGKAKNITFPAKVTVKDSLLKAEALIKINRLDWGMNYASDPQGAQYILPEVDLHLVLSAAEK